MHYYNALVTILGLIRSFQLLGREAGRTGILSSPDQLRKPRPREVSGFSVSRAASEWLDPKSSNPELHHILLKHEHFTEIPAPQGWTTSKMETKYLEAEVTPDEDREI